MSGKLGFTAGLTVGLLAGSRAGRGLYDRTAAAASALVSDPRVRKGASSAMHKAASAGSSMAGAAARKVTHRGRGQEVGEGDEGGAGAETAEGARTGAGAGATGTATASSTGDVSGITAGWHSRDKAPKPESDRGMRRAEADGRRRRRMGMSAPSVQARPRLRTRSTGGG